MSGAVARCPRSPGDLLTPGSTDRSTYEYTDEDGNKVTIPSVGESIFNSLGLDVKLGAIGISVKGEAVGPIGALQCLEDRRRQRHREEAARHRPGN
ncbi:hypothetical protein [Mycobacterium sp. NPDC004974]